MPTDKKPVTYYDDGQAGLCVIVTYGGAKTYYAYMKFQGTPKRIKIGRVGVTKLVEARVKVRELKATADKGVDPSEERRDHNIHRYISDLSHKLKMSLCFAIIWRHCIIAK